MNRDYYSQIKNIVVLKKEEEVLLVRKIKTGCKASRNHLIESNLRLVVKIANEFSGYRDVPFEDLVSEGNQGLMFAIDYFDPSKGCRFSTYSKWWIKKFISRFIEKYSKSVSLPKRELKSVKTLSIDDDDNSLTEILFNEDPIASENVDHSERLALMLKAMKTLTKREQFVIKARFGMLGNRWSFNSIGRRIRRSEDMARRIEATALAKLRDTFARES